MAAAREMGIKVPLVVRLEGTSGLKIGPADNLADAAAKITAAVKKAA